MEIKIEDLKIGDEILLCGQNTKYLKVLELPRLDESKSWTPTVPRYKAIKCQSNVESVPYNSYDWSSGSRTPIIKYAKKYKLEPPYDTSPVARFDMNGNKIWLIHRSGI
jgi:hypothetical protein